MKWLKLKWEGFTVLELIIILLIIGMMTAIALPIYEANLTRTKEIEAESTLDTIRTFLKIYYAIHESYPVSPQSVNVVKLSELNISSQELAGKYYSADCYYYQSTTGSDYILRAECETLPSLTMNDAGSVSKPDKIKLSSL